MSIKITIKATPVAGAVQALVRAIEVDATTLQIVQGGADKTFTSASDFQDILIGDASALMVVSPKWPDTGALVQPQIVNFVATPSSTVSAGASSTLSWSSIGGVSATLKIGAANPVSVALAGSQVVNPVANTDYVLTIQGAAGTTPASQTRTVTVGAATPQPVINSFTTSASSVSTGATISLSWTTTNATSVQISDDAGSPITTGGTSGNVLRFPTVNTTYTLRAIGPAGEATAALQVLVTQVTGGSSDPNAASVAFLLRGNNAASTTVTDEVSGNAWAAAGSLGQTATGAIEGAASFDFAGNTGSKYLSSTTAALMTRLGFGTGDFTVEVTIKPGTLPSFYTPLVMTTTWGLRLRNFGAEVEWDGNNFTAPNLFDGNAHRIAVTRSAGTLRAFVDGVLLGLSGQAPGGTPWATNVAAPTAAFLGVNSAASTDAFVGLMDEARGTQGVARYVASYTALPPGTSFPSLTGGGGGGSPVAGDVVDSTGTIVPTSYQAIFRAYADDSVGIPYRYGPPATAPGVPTLSQRADIDRIRYGGTTTNGQGTAPPDVYWQIGGPISMNGPPSVGFNDFVTSDGAAVSAATGTTPWQSFAGRYMSWAIDRATVAQRPQLMWQQPTYYPQQIGDYVAMGASLGLDPTNPADRPVCIAQYQGPGDSGASKMALVATQGSATRGARVYTVGTATSEQRGLCILPAGMTVTSMSITSGGEMCCLTLCDHVNIKGFVGIIALGGTPAGITWTQPGPYYDWWHEFTDMAHPLFNNRGGWTFMKWMGAVPLPDECKAPTHCHAYTGRHPYEVLYLNGQPSGIGQLGSPMASNRTRFLPGGDLYPWYAKGGLLTVTSASEKKAVFVDLTPLFEYANGMYFNSAASNLETQNLGMADNQWPYPFSARPQAMPTVVKTVTLTSSPRGVFSPTSYNYDSRNQTRRQPGTPGYPMPDPHYPRVWIACDAVDGTGEIQIFACDTYVPGPKPVPVVRVPADIYQIGVVPNVGQRITCVAAVKDFDVSAQGVTYDPLDAPPGCLDEMVAVSCRPERAIKWIQFAVTSGSSGAVVRTMRDSRMDVTSFSHVDGYHKSNKVVVVANYSGKQVQTYRAYSDNPLNYAGVSYPTLDVNAPGEFGGALDVDGYVFGVTTTNAP